MNHSSQKIVIGVFSFLFCYSISFAKPSTKFANPKDKLSYAIGFDIGKTLQSQDIAIQVTMLQKGLQDAISNQKGLLSSEEARTIIVEFQKEQRAKFQQKRDQRGDVNKEEGKRFLAQNKKQPGVITLDSGLQYKVLVPGKDSAKKPQRKDTVTTHYRGTLLDGTEFDSSYSRGKPATFPVQGVIPGWTEALQLMPVGAKWQLFIPADLAYGERGAGQKIGSHATLIFELELLSVQ